MEMEEIDQYIGLALKVSDCENIESKTKFFVTYARDEHDLDAHVNVSSQIWGLDQESANKALKQRIQYFNLSSRRGNFLVVYDGEKAIGNGGYRFRDI